MIIRGATLFSFPVNNHFRQGRSLGFIVFCCMVFTAIAASSVYGQNCSSTPVLEGYRDFNYGNTLPNNAPTSEKPESKLWINDGFWWAVMWNTAAAKYRIHKFDKNNQCFENVGPDVDDRPKTLSDALWDGQKLYIASHMYEGFTGSARLYRYSYNSSTDTYTLDTGFPVDITTHNPEAMTIAKDSGGKLWITYERGNTIWINRSTTNDQTWGSAFQLPVQGGNVSGDDISAILAFTGNKIGVLWSNQNDKKMYFAVHNDGDGDTTWQPREEALSDPALGAVADDHINLKMTSDGGGNVYAVTKTSLSVDSAPLIYVLRRTSNGTWSQFIFGLKRDDHTRPIILVDEENRELYVFANGGDGTIRMKSTSLDNISFATGKGDIFIDSSSDNDINDPTSTKQNLNGSTDLLVLASDAGSKNYLHNFIDLTSAGPAPEITVNPSSHDYGDVVVGSSAQQTFVVTNDGTANLDVSSTTLVGTDGGQYEIDSGGGSFTLTPGQNRNVLVSFNPSSLGTKNATLRFDTNDADEDPKDVSLTGNGISTPVPEITVNPASHNYGDVVVGSSSQQTFVVTNDGGANLVVTTTTLVGTDAGQFVIDSGGGAFTLTPGQNRNVLVSFNPSSLGTKNGTLRFDTNDADEDPKDVALSGTSVDTPPPGGDITFEEVKTGGSSSLASVATSASLTGVSGHLYLAAISTKNRVDVTAVTGLGLTWTLVDAQCAGRNQTGVEVWMAQGSASSGVVTASLAGAPANAVIVVTRYSGVASLNPIGAVISGNTNGLNGLCSGGSDNSSYSFNISTSVAGAVVYGAVAMRNRLHTPGAGYTERAEIIQGASGSQAGAAVQDRSVATPGVVALNGTFSATVDWAVIGLEIKPGSGGGSPSPEITVNPSSHDYGDVVVGSSAQQTFVVTNDGGADLDVASTTLVGTDAGQYAIDSGGGAFTLTPGQNRNVVVSFNPTSLGTKNATLRFDTNDADEDPKDVSLTGNGISTPAPDITVNPASHNYGDVVVGNSSQQTFVVTNDGGANLDGALTTLEGADAGQFSIDSGGGAFTLTPGQTRNVAVSFNPTSLGTKNATLRFDTNDTDEDPKDAALTGNGVDTPPPGGDITFEEVKTGGSSSLASVATSASLTGVSGHLYLAAISTKGRVDVTGVTGLGLTWTLVDAQCAGRNQTGVEVWMAQGNASSGVVTATLASVPNFAVIVVTRYSGVASSNPIGVVISGNTNGLNGSCSGGSDSNNYSFNITTSVSGAVVYGAVALRNKTHTPGAGYTERAEIVQGASGNQAGAAVQDKIVASPGIVVLNGTLSAAVDWAVIGLEIKPSGSSSSAKLAVNDSGEGGRTVSGIPDDYRLFQNYPNPFNAETVIEYVLPDFEEAQLVVYNLLGQVVRELVHEKQSAGYHKVQWDGKDHFGQAVSSGTYFLRLRAGQFHQLIKITLQK